MIPVDITMVFIVGMSLALVVRKKLRNIESIFYDDRILNYRGGLNDR